MELNTKYLERLADLYPSIARASTEIINLQAILNLPKGTEHFVTDIHGEYEAFSHVLKNGSGSVRRKIDEVFGNTLSIADKRSLATLIYYPREKMDLVLKKEKNPSDWYKITLYRLIEVCKKASSKYTRSKIRKALPQDFAYVIEELITEKSGVDDKEAYYNEIVRAIIETGRAKFFIEAMCKLIQRLVVDHLHILGDIYDRGSGSPAIMDKLAVYHSLDIQWGNHDILWMGAAAGQRSCIANVVRICSRYGNLDMLEEGYGINMLPLATLAMNVYGNDPCTCFKTKGDASFTSVTEEQMSIKMHKAISIIQFKLEGQLIAKRKNYGMESRRLLHLIDYKKGSIMLDGKEYPLIDKNFPTINPEKPYELSKEEREVIERLQNAFENCEKLQNHIRFMLSKGSLYKVYNGNLLYHGCMPLTESGELSDVKLYGKTYRGKELYDAMEKYVRQAFFAIDDDEREKGRDLMWYIWCAKDSPLFGKDKMATFERYFIADKTTHTEKKNPYYSHLDDEEVIVKILKDFGLEGDDCHVVNGHVPVKQKKGESPVKCGGRVLVIDGGFARAYQGDTGIAGYTLIFNSYGMLLVAHEPFTSTESAIADETDIHSDSIMRERTTKRLLVGDTDDGKALRERVEELKELLEAYRSGRIRERA